MLTEVTLDPDETIVSYDVTLQFTCVPTEEAVKMVTKCLLQDSTLSSRTAFNIHIRQQQVGQ